jgi:hypothetical protein
MPCSFSSQFGVQENSALNKNLDNCAYYAAFCYSLASVITNSRVRRYLRLSGSAPSGRRGNQLAPPARWGDDHDAGLRHLGSAPLAHKTLHTLVAGVEAVVGDQVLPDRPRIPASAEPQLDGFTGTARRHWREDCDPEDTRNAPHAGGLPLGASGRSLRLIGVGRGR